MEDGPMLPEHLFNPCGININKTTYLLASNLIITKNGTEKFFSHPKFSFWIFHFNFDNWIDVKMGFPCPNMAHSRLMCAKYSVSNIIISLFPINGAICTGIFDLTSLKWIRRNELLVENPQNSMIINPIEENLETLLINDGDVYQLIHFEWRFQWPMKTKLNSSAYLGQSKLLLKTLDNRASF